MRHAILTHRTLRTFAALTALSLITVTSAHAAWEAPAVPTATMAAENALPQPGITATVSQFYKITSQDVGAAVAEQLQAQGIETKAEALLGPGTPGVLYTSDHPIKVSLHALQVDTKSKRWQGEVYFLGNGKTESVRPIAGTYSTLVDVPVVTRQLSKMDVIEDKDIAMISVAEPKLRKDTITDPKQLIGLSPRNGISANRPIHANEVSAPVVIKRGDIVEMSYNTPYIHIKTSGIALEDGTKGGPIRVKNQKSQLAVSAKVDGVGRVSVAGSDTTL